MFARAAKLAREKARHPHCPPDEAKALALALVDFLRDFKGHTVDDLWARAEERGIRSRSHMRQLLYWMRQERLVGVEAPVPGSRVRYFRLLRDPERAERELEVIRQRDTELLSMSRQEQAQKEYDDRKPLGRRLTYWDL